MEFFAVFQKYLFELLLIKRLLRLGLQPNKFTTMIRFSGTRLKANGH